MKERFYDGVLVGIELDPDEDATVIAALDAMNEVADEMPDGAWGAMMCDAVTSHNQANDTHYDPHETWLAWIELRGELGEESA